MMAAMGLLEFLPVLGGAISLAFIIIIAGWLCYCIHSIARAADALERIADAQEDIAAELEDDDEDEDEDGKAKGGDK